MVVGNIKVGRNIEWYLIWVVSRITQFTQIKYHPIISTLTVCHMSRAFLRGNSNVSTNFEFRAQDLHIRVR
jgi:hypothetical protein